MPEYKAISGLPVASTVSGTDKVLIQQGSITKNADIELIVEYVEENSSTRIDDLESRVDTLESRADTEEARVDSLNTKVAALESIGPNWIDLATQWLEPPALTASIASGNIYSYVYESVTYYRLVPSPYVASSDVFYTTFSGGALSGPVAARG